MSDRRQWMREFGVRLRAARERAGLTQGDVARAVDVALNTIWKWESGKRPPCSYSVVRLCDLLGVDADSLLRGVQRPE